MGGVRWIHAVLAASLLGGGSVAEPPPEVAGVAFVDRATIAFETLPEAVGYNLYRGYLRELSSSFHGTVLEPEWPAGPFLDEVDPPHGQGFFYLVTAVSDGESTLGTEGDGTPRANTFPWPGFSVAGRWDLPIAWPGVAVHLMLLRDGKVLSWEGQPAPAQTWVWDPVTGGFSTYTASTNLFCAGHTQLPDGRMFVSGGDTLYSGHGAITTWTFTPGAATPWVRGPDMRNGRYYPTNTTLANGNVLVFSGQGSDGVINQQVEVYVEESGQPPRLDLLPGADWPLFAYPQMFLLPNGNVFHAGPEIFANILDPVTQTWWPVDLPGFANRIEGTAVMLPPGYQRFMIAGGRPTTEHEAPATATAEVIDLGQPNAQWTSLPSMRFERVFPNSVILPDGKVLLVGGGFNDDVPVYPAEMFDPATDGWSMMASQRSFRLYHSTAILLPDATVLSSGSNFNNTAEIYRPGYLFRGPRPLITSPPGSIRYNRAFGLSTNAAASIASVVLLRPGAATHAFNQDQRYVPLTFTVSGGGLRVDAPAHPNLAPPGYYMLFILNGQGVPSVASFVELKP